MPALLNITSSRPNSLSARATSAWISASAATSVRWNTHRFPASLALCATASPPAVLRSASTTCAPSRANRIALAAPMPLAAPVITATLPSNWPMPSSLFLSVFPTA